MRYESARARKNQVYDLRCDFMVKSWLTINNCVSNRKCTSAGNQDLLLDNLCCLIVISHALTYVYPSSLL